MHTCKRPPHFCFAQGNFVTLGIRLPLQPQLWGDRSPDVGHTTLQGRQDAALPKQITSTPWGNDRSRAQGSASIH